MSPLTLWLTDRSRYTTGTGRCPRQRYLTNHFGPTGYGIVRTGESLPLATGKYTHLAIERLMQHLQQTDTFPPVPVIRAAIAEATAAYQQQVEQKGYRGLLASERTDYVVTEQTTLLEGLIWAFSRTILPFLFTNYKVVEAEQESIYILDCTCGLGSANTDAQAHSDKGCQGIGQMLKQDCIAVHRQHGTGAYFETKTTGWAGDTWATQWETKPQLPIGTFGIQERLGIEITETFIVGLYKGRRTKVKDAWGGEMYRQESPLTYGYRRPGNPPLATDDWVPSYEWTDTRTGEVKRKSRAHEKAPIWELAQSDWPLWVESHAQDPTLTPVEFWTSWLPESVINQQVFLVGPLRPHPRQIESLKVQIAGEENRWRETLWDLYEKQQIEPWASADFQARLDRDVPASWDCRRFGAQSQCEFVPICFHQDGWEDPLATGQYVPRRPHHQPELEAAIERGLLPEAEEGEEVEE